MAQREHDPRTDDQPERDDLVEPEDVWADEVDEPTQDEDVGELPSKEELPESQGADVLEAERWTEDASSRRLLADEEAELRRSERSP